MSKFNITDTKDVRQYCLMLIRPSHCEESCTSDGIEKISRVANEATDDSMNSQKIFKDYLLSSEIYKIV